MTNGSSHHTEIRCVQPIDFPSFLGSRAPGTSHQNKGSNAGGQRGDRANDDGDMERREERLALRGNHATDKRRRDQATQSRERTVETRGGASVTRIHRSENRCCKRRNSAGHAYRNDNDGREYAAPITGLRIK